MTDNPKSEKDLAMENDQELQKWLSSFRDEAPTDLEMARWKQAVNKQSAKKAPAPKRHWIWTASIELTKVAALLTVGFLGGDYYAKVLETDSQSFSQVAVGTPPMMKGANVSGGSAAMDEGMAVSALSDSYPLLSSKSVRVVDGKGKTWVSSLDMDSEFVGITTNQGTLVFSTYPFRGAEAVGQADGTQARLKFMSGLEIRLTSATPLLSSGGKANLYALFTSATKTKGVGVVQVFESETEDRILARIETTPATVLSQ